ncbi:hypothetical protein Droror1_Dr00005461 [Drosera rotundifolia]
MTTEQVGEDDDIVRAGGRGGDDDEDEEEYEEWRFVMPLLEEAGLESWAVDILGWGFSDLEGRPSCNVASKRSHLYQVTKLILSEASEAALLRSMPLRLYVNRLALKGISFDTNLDCMNIGRLHCHFPWWEDATVDFMRSGWLGEPYLMPLHSMRRMR